MRKPVLYILCGCAGCGKSSWAREMAEHTNAMYVSRDAIRFSLIKEDEEYFSHEDIVFSQFERTIATYLRNSADVIADATHLNKRSRRKLIYGIDRQSVTDYQIIFVYFNTSFEVCCRRNALREGRARVPDDAMQSMWEGQQKPSLMEDKRCIGLILVKGE